MRLMLNILGLLLFFVSAASTLQAQDFYYDYRDAGGDWQNRMVANKIVLVADSRGQMGYFDIELPVDGQYKIYASVMHRWNTAWPMIETRITQNGHVVQDGYFTVEPGELSHQKEGRWLIKSMDRGEAPYLKKGMARVEFRLNSKNLIRVKGEGEIEGEVFFGNIVVIPGSDDVGFMNILEAERCSGDWDLIEYRVEDRCGIIESTADGYARLQVFIPQAGEYQIAALLRNEGETELRAAVSRDEKKLTDFSRILLNRDNLWKMQPIFTRYLQKGMHYIQLENGSSSKVWIDHFLVVPNYPVEQEDIRTLSCSTVYFYHNEGAANLGDAITRIMQAGFQDVDIIAYDETFGFGDGILEEEVVEIQKLLQHLKGKAASIHFGYIPLRSVEEAVERIQWAVWLAGIVGAERIVAPASLDITGRSFLSKDEGREQLARVIGQVRPLLEVSGIELGLENHGGRQWLFQGEKDFLAARELLAKNITFVLDERHFSLFGENPEDVFRQLLPYSRYVHFKSENKKYIRRLKEILIEYQYHGGVSLEVEEEGVGLKEWFALYHEIL